MLDWKLRMVAGVRDTDGHVLRVRNPELSELLTGLKEEVVAEVTIHAGFRMCADIPGPGTYMVVRKPNPEFEISQ